jgi:hypothetical protein
MDREIGDSRHIATCGYGWTSRAGCPISHASELVEATTMHICNGGLGCAGLDCACPCHFDEATARVWLVIESTPGYMPDSEPADFDEYADAVSYADERTGYTCDRSWASSGNYDAISCTRPDAEHDLGRWIAVERDES